MARLRPAPAERGRGLWFAACAALLSLLLLGSTGSPARVQLHRAASVALPQNQLHFGLSNDPAHLSWMTTSGVSWRYRYQYLAGGVNTPYPQPWIYWNSPSGAFATYYMNASNANGYIPVFTYYELLQSLPSTGTNESSRDFSNLNDTSTMNAYYANFKLLMQLAGTFGKPVVVHVEPDFWGYMEQRAAGGDASTLTASVATSGFTELAGLPNTVQGFAYALLKLRDMYGPNAILATHASMWSSGTDIASDTRSTINAATEADRTAAFLNSAGISSNPYGSTWDLVFNDVDDHDAGWWEQQGADNASFTHWWDPTNTVFPNFNRYLSWVAELRARTGRPQVVWQVPVGNQYFLTMNNTCGHYQDNVGPYFISHASSLYSSGLIAVLFGAGNACQTSYWDQQTDGVTNNGGVPTTDLLGYCNACNTHLAQSSDDDGGFLRTFVGQYYAGCVTQGGSPVLAGFSGSGKADLAFISGSGVCVVPSTGSAFAFPWPASVPFYGSRTTLPGDVMGSGKAALVAVSNTQDFVLPSTGTAFGLPAAWSNVPFYGTRGTFLADVNGDGKADLVAVNDTSVWVMLSTGSGFGPPTPWSNTPFYGNVATLVGDVSGDGKADLVAVNSGSTWIMASTGSGFGSPMLWSGTPFYGNRTTLVADVTGDGKADLVAVNSSGAWVMSSTGSGFAGPALWSGTPFYGSQATVAADVNGDGKSDLVALSPGVVFVEPSTGAAFSLPAGWF
jgi:hypothetical protein